VFVAFSESSWHENELTGVNIGTQLAGLLYLYTGRMISFCISKPYKEFHEDFSNLPVAAFQDDEVRFGI
jgi:hypothetical protein